MASKVFIRNEWNTLVKNSPEILVFYVKIGDLWDDDYKFETALRILPFSQRTKIIAKKFSNDSKTSLANLLLQYFIASLFTGKQDPETIQFKRNQYGKPSLDDSYANFTFSMSNQQGYTSMVVDLKGNEIGIDLAHVSDVDGFQDQYLDHFKGIFHEEEYRYLQRIEDKDNLKLLFTEYWALKESYTKKLGVGLNGDLTSYNFRKVPILTPDEDLCISGTYFKTRESVKWRNETELSIYDNVEKDLDIQMTLIEPKLVVSICGKLPQNAKLVEITIETLTEYFTS